MASEPTSPIWIDKNTDKPNREIVRILMHSLWTLYHNMAVSRTFCVVWFYNSDHVDSCTVSSAKIWAHVLVREQWLYCSHGYRRLYKQWVQYTSNMYRHTSMMKRMCCWYFESSRVSSLPLFRGRTNSIGINRHLSIADEARQSLGGIGSCLYLYESSIISRSHWDWISSESQVTSQKKKHNHFGHL